MFLYLVDSTNEVLKKENKKIKLKIKVEKKQKTSIFNNWKTWNFSKKFCLEKMLFLYLVMYYPQVRF